LEAAIELAHFYDTIRRAFTAQNMMYSPIIKNFNVLWDALKEKKKKEQLEVPKLGKGVSFVKWIELFRDHCYQCIGMQFVPLAAVICKEVAVALNCLAQANSQPYSEEHGSIAGDLIHQSSYSCGNLKKIMPKCISILRK